MYLDSLLLPEGRIQQGLDFGSVASPCGAEEADAVLAEKGFGPGGEMPDTGPGPGCQLETESAFRLNSRQRDENTVSGRNNRLSPRVGGSDTLPVSRTRADEQEESCVCTVPALQHLRAPGPAGHFPGKPCYDPRLLRAASAQEGLTVVHGRTTSRGG